MVKRGRKPKAEEDKVTRRNITFTREIMSMLDEIANSKKFGGKRSRTIAFLIKKEYKDMAEAKSKAIQTDFNHEFKDILA